MTAGSIMDRPLSRTLRSMLAQHVKGYCRTGSILLEAHPQHACTWLQVKVTAVNTDHITTVLQIMAARKS